MSFLTPTRNDVPFKNCTVHSFDPESKVFYTVQGKESHLATCFTGPVITGGGQSTVDKLIAAISMPLPAGSFIQVGLLCLPYTANIVDRYLSAKAGASGLTGELVRRHHQLTANSVDVPLVARSGILLHSQRLVVTIKTPVKQVNRAEIEEARDYATRFDEALRAAGLSQLKRIGGSEYLFLMRTILRPWDEPDFTYDEDVPLREQIFAPGDEIDYTDTRTIKFHGGEHYGKLLSVKHFPEETTLGKMNFIIGDPDGVNNQITEPYWMVTTLRYPNQTEANQFANTRSAILTKQAVGPMGKIPGLRQKKESFDLLLQEKSSRGGLWVETNFSVFLLSRNLSNLKKLSSGLISYYASLGYHCREDMKILETMWDNCLPMNTCSEGIKNTFRFKVQITPHAVNFLPLIGDWSGTGPSGSMLFVTRRGSPVLFDLYDSGTNFNGCVFAESGAGKSFFTQKVVSDYLAQGAKIWAIDIGGSYKKLSKMVGGSFMEFSMESDICLNPFTHITGNLDEEMDVLKAIIAKMAAPEEKLSDYQMATMEQAITSVYQKFGNKATIGAVAQYLREQPEEDAQRLAKQLYPFAGGAYTRWFDGDNNLDMDNAFVVLELQDLNAKKNLQQVVLLQLIARINQDIYQTHSRKKILILDEAWELLDDPLIAKALEALYRKARKHDGSIIIVTQSIADLYNSPNARAIAANSSWNFILQQKETSIDAAIEGKQFIIEPFGERMLKSVHTLKGKYSEIMIYRNSTEWGIVRLVTDRFTGVTFSTDGKERDEVMGAMDRGVDPVRAVQEFIDRYEGPRDMRLAA